MATKQKNALFDKRFTPKMQKKLAMLFLGIGLAFIALVVRMVMIQDRSGEEYTRIVLNQQQYNSRTVPFKRGDIRDRNGTVLATSQKVYDVILDAKTLLRDKKNIEPTLRFLKELFEIDTDEVKTFISTSPSSQYKILIKGIDYKKAQEFEKSYNSVAEGPHPDGLWLQERFQRSYPLGTLACDVLGFMGNEDQGSCGLEAAYNNVLNGKDGRTFGYAGSETSDMTVSKDPVDGSHLVTTIDVNIQAIVEKKIKQFNDEHAGEGRKGSANTGVIVMDPNNGEILAEASYPVFDPNKPGDLNKAYTKRQIEGMDDEEKNKAMNSLWNNYCVSGTYEPGSTFKPFTVAAALETAAIKGDETYYCPGALKVDDHLIHCHNTGGHGRVSVEDAVAESCNVALMKIAEELGAEAFTKYQHIFGFGEYTGIDVPGEGSTASLLYKAGDMKASDLATNSFGQGFNVTMTQMAAGFCSLINGGRYYAPHFLKEIRSHSDNLQESADESVIKKTVSAQTSKLIRQYTTAVVERGTGRRTQIKGYSIGGKTGTAEKLPRGNGKYVLSFVGYAPTEQPRVLIYVVIDEPHVDKQDDSSLVTQLSHDILAEVLPYMEIETSEE